MDTQNIDNNLTCRACLENNHDNNNMKSIYKVEQIQNTPIKFCTILNYCTNLDVYEGDGLPGKICKQCADDVIKAFTFKQQFIRANAILREKLSSIGKDNGETQKSNYAFEYVFVKLENPNSRNGNEIGCDDDDDDDDNTPVDLEGLNFENTLQDDPQPLNCNDNENSDVDKATSITEDDKLLEKKNKISEKMKSMLKDNEMAVITDRAISSYIRELKRKPKSRQIFTCEICSKSLSSAGSLKTHLLTHSSTSQFLCSTCGEGFKTKSSYEDHIVTHDPNTPFKCDECNKIYKNERSLKDHNARAHSSVKPFVCGVCGKGLTQKVALQKHMMIHTGEKPFECDVCGKHFRYKNVLVLHNRYHTGERPYSCSECGQTFIGRSHYRTHLLIHTGVKPYECDICGKCFNRRTNLRSHRKIHTGERQHICSICGKGFIQNNCLRAHMATHEQQNQKENQVMEEEEQQVEDNLNQKSDSESSSHQYQEAPHLMHITSELPLEIPLDGVSITFVDGSMVD